MCVVRHTVAYAHTRTFSAETHTTPAPQPLLQPHLTLLFLLPPNKAAFQNAKDSEALALANGH